jgi:hypothetical protein
MFVFPTQEYFVFGLCVLLIGFVRVAYVIIPCCTIRISRTDLPNKGNGNCRD